MKAKIKATGELIEVKEWRGAFNAIYSTSDMNMFYADNELELLPDTHEQVTIEGYVARDKVSNHHRGEGLHLFTSKPERSSIFAEWQGLRGKSLLIDPDMFPEVTWESEPKRVRITITPMEE